MTSLIYYLKLNLCLDSSLTKHPKPKLFFFFVLSIHHKWIISLLKKHKSCLLWPLLRSHFFENPIHMN